MSPVVTSKDVTIRLFKNGFLEFFSRVHWSVPLILYLPLLFFCLFKSLNDPGTTWYSILSFIFFGLFSWTLLEYFLHRFLFHFKPKSDLGRRFFYIIHEIHHEYPADSLRLVMPPILSIPLAILFYSGLSYTMPPQAFFPYFSGLAIGYLSYDMIHYSAHHLPMKGKIGQFLKQYHLRHHYQQEDRGYGVSSPLWDYILRTELPSKSKVHPAEVSPSTT